MPKALVGNLELIAAEQFGYFTATQAQNSGYVYQHHCYHVRSQHWLKLGRGLFRLPGYEDTFESDLMYWLLWSRNQQDQPQAVISHQSALALHGRGEPDRQIIHLTVPVEFRKRLPAGCKLYKRNLPISAIEARGRLLLTALPQTLVDLELPHRELGGSPALPAGRPDQEMRLAPELIPPLIPSSATEEPEAVQLADEGQIPLPMRERIFKMMYDRAVRPLRTPRAQAGFTLVELLVVIAIISVLAALLLPALRQAHGQALSIACSSNLKQSSLLINQYADENSGLIFSHFFPPSQAWYGWNWRLIQDNYMPCGGLVGKPVGSVIYSCPLEYSAKVLISRNLQAYGMNYLCKNPGWTESAAQKTIAEAAGNTFLVVRDKIRKPSGLLFLGDSFDMWVYNNMSGQKVQKCAYGLNDALSGSHVWLRHVGAVGNILFYDGHAQTVNYAKVLDCVGTDTLVRVGEQ